MNNQKKFGVWMDNQHAVVVGTDNTDDNTLKVLAHIKAETASSNSNEKNANNHEKSLHTKFFKEIGTHIVNATHVHVTGTGQTQEQFIHYLADTPQFKNSITEESTSNKLSDEALVDYITSKL